MTMGASYHRKTGTAEREYAISQKSLAFFGALVGLAVSVFSAGITYGVMRAQLDGKLDRTTYSADMQTVDRRITRDSSIVQIQAAEVLELKESMQRTERRVTDIACDLIRPRRPYCR